jgi:nucleotide-binding universal stress UspA family protein
MKILLAVDGSLCSEAVARELVVRPGPPGSEIRVISVVELVVSAVPETWTLPYDYFEETNKALQIQAEAAVQTAISILQQIDDKTLKISSIVLEGSPQHAILEEAKRWKADLIVVGSHGRKGIERLIIGSVSQAIASHAECSVEIVRCPEATDSEGR